MSTILSVSEITGLIKQTLESEFGDVSVVGEISNFKAHISGHWYFTLKDSNSQINCTMWRGLNSYVFFTPQDGMKIIANGKISVYQPRGSYQLDIRSMKPAGVGELQAAFEKLKQKLFEEGLFDEVHKKPIPRFPNKLGIVTAIDGAAFQDMKSIAARRYPLVELVIASSRVQGDGAAEEIAKSIKLLNNQNDIDVIVVGRGGGSLEDLWAFNEEIVARAIFDSRIPVISAVGHEIDFTIADFAADLRAATPSAAIELATPNRDDLLSYVSDFSYYNSQKIFEILRSYRDEVTSYITSYGFKMPQDFIKSKTQRLDSVLYKFSNFAESKISTGKARIELLESRIKAMSVDGVLKRGFSYIKQNESVVTRMKNFSSENSFSIKFYDGEIKIDGKEKRK
ncbi:MAG: exodeoxyribonuclease VII large subunit [Ignavibacteria bacterium]|nr:MAG: exodeoxyribonuclease VII large subunit [Ignavibacteria bacterium]KAF0161724.1 MAG: exodeoxyribonuclease VII large subunit [Ignavibacteria bacterium]